MKILTNEAKAKVKQKFGDLILAAAPIPQIDNPAFDPDLPEDKETNPSLVDKYTGSRWLDIYTMRLWQPVLKLGRNKIAQESADDDWET